MAQTLRGIWAVICPSTLRNYRLIRDINQGQARRSIPDPDNRINHLHDPDDSPCRRRGMKC
jgi:hypothetical protein